MTGADDPGSRDTASRRLDRWSGSCLIATGLFLLTTAIPRLRADLRRRRPRHPLWTATHAPLIAATILSLVGLSDRHEASAPDGPPP
jgi:hypothetical protein